MSDFMISIVLLAVLIGVVLALSKGRERAPERDSAPEGGGPNGPVDIAVTDADGRSVSPSDFRGRPVVINFWATWCPPCKAELPAFDAIAAEYEGRAAFMMVNLTDGTRDTPESVRQFIAEKGFKFPVYCDLEGDAANAFAVRSIPVTVFLKSDGSVSEVRAGAMTESSLREALDGLLAG